MMATICRTQAWHLIPDLLKQAGRSHFSISLDAGGETVCYLISDATADRLLMAVAASRLRSFFGSGLLRCASIDDCGEDDGA